MAQSKKGGKFTITEMDYILAVRKADREREIEMHGKLISTRPTRIHKSKKVYNRNNSKKLQDE